MFRYNIVFLTALLVLSIIPSDAKKTFGGGSGRHSYPSSRGGLSGGGHGYPSSGNHGYPSSGGLSGNNQGHAYPSSGGSHGYPSSGGMSGGMSGGNHGYPSGGSAYPSNTHHSNNHGYPASKGLSGNSPSSGTGSSNVHHHYHYSPPQQIRYTPAHGGPPVSYPVYRGTPPTYVYQYKDSGSKYGTLLAGLALLNLGTLAGGIYAATHHGSGSGSGSSYKGQPGEICKFGVRKDNGDYEETRIDCQLISSFIYEEQAKAQTGGNNITTITTTTNTTMIVNGTGEAQPANIEPKYVMLPNGTLVPMNISIVNATSEGSPANNSMTSMVTVTTVTNTTVTNALDAKGKPVEVTPGMKCYVIRNSPTTNMKRSVPCGLLQTYAEQSLKKNSASRNVPAFTILTAICAALILY